MQEIKNGIDRTHLVYILAAIAMILASVGAFQLRTAVDNKKKRGRESKANKRLMARSLILLFLGFALGVIIEVFWW